MQTLRAFLARMFSGVVKADLTPEVTHPRVTALEAKRRILEKAQKEYRLRAQLGRERLKGGM